MPASEPGASRGRASRLHATTTGNTTTFYDPVGRNLGWYATSR